MNFHPASPRCRAAPVSHASACAWSQKRWRPVWPRRGWSPSLKVFCVSRLPPDLLSSGTSSWLGPHCTTRQVLDWARGKHDKLLARQWQCVDSMLNQPFNPSKVGIPWDDKKKTTKNIEHLNQSNSSDLIEIWIKRKNLFATGVLTLLTKTELHWSRPKGEAKDEDASKTLVTNLDFLPV